MCGNGKLEDGEECDAGKDNGKPGSGCSKDCKKTAVCGNGKKEDGEECKCLPLDSCILHEEEITDIARAGDLGPNNGKPNSGCTKDCKVCAVCGNGKLEDGEECDAGKDNGKPGSGCSTDCKKTAVCGNGKKEEGEECKQQSLRFPPWQASSEWKWGLTSLTGDLGPDNGKPNSGCTKYCKLCAVCGNGKKEEGEECKRPLTAVTTRKLTYIVGRRSRSRQRQAQQRL